MAKRAKVLKTRNLINSTGRLFAALQRVDQKVDDFINSKADTLEALETSIDAYSAPEETETKPN